MPTVTHFKLSVDKLMTDHVLCSVSFVLDYNMYDSDDIHRPAVTVASSRAQSSEGLSTPFEASLFFVKSGFCNALNGTSLG